MIKLTRFHAARRCWPSGFARTKDEDGSRQQVPFSPCPTRPGWAGRLDHLLSRPLREMRRLKVITTLFFVLVGNTLLVSLEMSLKSLLVHGSEESIIGCHLTGCFARLSSVVESSRYRWSSSLGSHLGRVDESLRTINEEFTPLMSSLLSSSSSPLSFYPFLFFIFVC